MCDTSTHYCMAVSVGSSQTLSPSLCCPLPCRSDHIFKDGACYGRAKPGETCVVRDQCSSLNADCVAGKCTCAAGQVSDLDTGYCSPAKCPPDQRMMNFSTSSPSSNMPLRDAKGDFVRCNSSQGCNGGFYCVQPLICCPQPAPYCALSKKFVSPNDRCVLDHFRFLPDREITTLREGAYGFCPEGKICTYWYDGLKSVEGNKTMMEMVGLCCPAPDNSV